MGNILYRYDDEEFQEHEIAQFHEWVAREALEGDTSDATGRTGTNADYIEGLFNGSPVVEVTPELYEIMRQKHAT